MEQITRREAISLLRNKLREVNADSTFTNRFLYSVLNEHAKWLIIREFKSSKLTSSKSLYRILPCMPTKKVSRIDERCPIKIEGLDIYRTEKRLPDVWENERGPIIRRVMSIDNFTNYKLISASDWQDKKNNPYLDKTKEKYVFYEDGYLWFPEAHPKNVNVEAFFKDDISDYNYCDCEIETECKKFLDHPFFIPSWIQAELMDKAFQQLAGQTMAIPHDTNINKNTLIKN